MQNHSSESNFDLHENEIACRTHFHMKGFELILVLKQRDKRTRKWPIEWVVLFIFVNNGGLSKLFLSSLMVT